MNSLFGGFFIGAHSAVFVREFYALTVDSPVFLGARRHEEVVFSSVLEICFTTVAPERAYYTVYCDRLDISLISIRGSISWPC